MRKDLRDLRIVCIMGSMSEMHTKKDSGWRIKPEVIDKIRLSNNLQSDEHVARKVGVSLGTVSRVRRGYDVRLDPAVKMMRAAGIVDIREAITQAEVKDSAPAA